MASTSPSRQLWMRRAALHDVAVCPLGLSGVDGPTPRASHSRRRKVQNVSPKSLNRKYLRGQLLRNLYGAAPIDGLREPIFERDERLISEKSSGARDVRLR